jgi:cytochrome c
MGSLLIRQRSLLLRTAFLALMAEAAYAAGDAAEGEKVFRNCSPCHSVANKTNKAGPYLQGVVGRPVATAEGYAYYSEAMKALGATGAVWDEATLDAFLKDPRGFVQGTGMRSLPIKRETERADLIAFLKSN